MSLVGSAADTDSRRNLHRHSGRRRHLDWIDRLSAYWKLQWNVRLNWSVPLTRDSRNDLDCTHTSATVNLTGTGMIANSPCFGSLTFSGQAIGGAFSLTDTTNMVHLTVVPTGSNFSFSYTSDSRGPSCAGDSGLGQLTNQSPWDY